MQTPWDGEDLEEMWAHGSDADIIAMISSCHAQAGIASAQEFVGRLMRFSVDVPILAASTHELVANKTPGRGRFEDDGSPLSGADSLRRLWRDKWDDAARVSWLRATAVGHVQLAQELVGIVLSTNGEAYLRHDDIAERPIHLSAPVQAMKPDGEVVEVREVVHHIDQ